MLFDILSVKVWAIESGVWARNYPTVLRWISQGHDITNLFKERPIADIFPSTEYIENPIAYDDPLTGSKSKSGKMVATIPIVGGLSKYGGLCSYGMQHHIQKIQRANAREDVQGIVLYMDTPGGTVDGTEELGHAIKTSKKPVVVFGDSMVASAGYWIASQAKEIVANKLNDTEFGSIGTLYVHADYSEALQKEGIKVEIFRAPQSVDKARINMIEPLEDAQRLEIAQELKEITDFFKSTVKSGRKGNLNTGEENIFTGKMYSREKALEMGMIDAIGTREDAIERAAALAESKISLSNKSSKQSNSMKWPKISSLLGKSASEDNPEGLSAEDMKQLDTVEQKLTDQEKQVGDLQAQVNTLTEENQTLKAEKATLEAEKKALQDENAKQAAELEKQPAGQATTVVSTKGDQFADDPKEQPKTSIEQEAGEYRKIIEESKQFNLN